MLGLGLAVCQAAGGDGDSKNTVEDRKIRQEEGLGAARSGRLVVASATRTARTGAKFATGYWDSAMLRFENRSACAAPYLVGFYGGTSLLGSCGVLAIAFSLR